MGHIATPIKDYRAPGMGAARNSSTMDICRPARLQPGHQEHRAAPHCRHRREPRPTTGPSPGDPAGPEGTCLPRDRAVVRRDGRPVRAREFITCGRKGGHRPGISPEQGRSSQHRWQIARARWWMPGTKKMGTVRGMGSADDQWPAVEDHPKRVVTLHVLKRIRGR